MNDSNVINNIVNLKKLREDKHLSQVQLAVNLGVSQELISRYEIGSSFPQPQMLIKLANFFNCSVDYLLGLTDIQVPVNSFNSASTLEATTLYNKYKSLSDEDKKYFERFLEFLIDNKSNE